MHSFIVESSIVICGSLWSLFSSPHLLVFFLEMKDRLLGMGMLRKDLHGLAIVFRLGEAIEVTWWRSNTNSLLLRTPQQGAVQCVLLVKPIRENSLLPVHHDTHVLFYDLRRNLRPVCHVLLLQLQQILVTWIVLQIIILLLK